MLVKRTFPIAICLAMGLTFGLSGCTQDAYTGEQKASRTAIGAGAGAALGAAAGYFIGKGDAGDRRTRALIGAGIGGLAGGGVGYYMDRQESQLRQRLQASGVGVQRVGNDIILIMPGNITFATNSPDINARFYEVLNSVGLVLKEYDKTLVDVTGHTDSTGSLQLNQRLSQERAQSVAQYLVSQGVDGRRMLVSGAGPSQPVASNATPDGRAQNRRVEIKLSPLMAN